MYEPRHAYKKKCKTKPVYLSLIKIFIVVSKPQSYANKFTSLRLANILAMTVHFVVFDLFAVSYMYSTH